MMSVSLGLDAVLLVGVVLGVLGEVDFRRVVMTTAPPAIDPLSEESAPAVYAEAGAARVRLFMSLSDSHPNVAVPEEAAESAMA